VSALVLPPHGPPVNTTAKTCEPLAKDGEDGEGDGESLVDEEKRGEKGQRLTSNLPTRVLLCL